MNKKTAIIIGAGPAGLTAAYEFLQRTDIKPIILEMSGDIGGISKTVNYKGNRIDIGGHRFFSKSDVVMDWWQNILPVESCVGDNQIETLISYQNKSRVIKRNEAKLDRNNTDNIMLIRNRLSRIFYLRKFFDYPISINFQTIKNLGLFRLISIGYSYILARLLPIKKEKSLEDFFINRFGKSLYKTFFTLIHFIRTHWIKKDDSIHQKSTETSLIEKFMYPKFGPGQLWEEVAKIVCEKGGKIIFHQKVVRIKYSGANITSVIAEDPATGKLNTYEAYYFFSTMPVKNLIRGMGISVPLVVQEIAMGLQYRDFITVGLLLNGMTIKNQTKIKTRNDVIPDNWIYIQEKDIRVGRIQVFNNWSPFMVQDEENIWLGLEYFCNENDDLWNNSEEDMKNFAISELIKMGMIEQENVLDGVVIKMPKTYPAYFGTYTQFDKLKEFTDGFHNLFLVGRNGMHKYNNQDHSMLTAMTAVNNIISGKTDKSNIWAVNTEQEYHEEKMETNREELVAAV